MAIGWKIVIYLMAGMISSIIPGLLFCLWGDSIMYRIISLLWAGICAFLLYQLYTKIGYVHYIFCTFTSSGLLSILLMMLVHIVTFLRSATSNIVKNEQSRARVRNMNKEAEKKKKPFYRKVLCICILIVVVVYCFPELQFKLISQMELLKDKWRITQ